MRSESRVRTSAEPVAQRPTDPDQSPQQYFWSLPSRHCFTRWRSDPSCPPASPHPHPLPRPPPLTALKMSTDDVIMKNLPPLLDRTAIAAELNLFFFLTHCESSVFRDSDSPPLLTSPDSPPSLSLLSVEGLIL